MKTILKLLFFSVTLLTIASCSSTKKLQGDSHSSKPTATELYKRRVVSNKINSEWLTAKMRLVLSMGDRDVSLSGSLKMKRGEVIQLSLTFPIVGEVGRMEFSPTNVLIIDRINARYVKVPYDRVDFLRSANLDFKVLESVFWNEVFYPGGDVNEKLGEYRVSEAGDHTLLNLSTAPKLDYDFLTITESALLDRTTVSPKNMADKNSLTCIYSDFVKFESAKFPSTIKISFVGEKQKYGLDLSLNSLSTASNWNTHTEVSTKYREMDVESLLKNLIP